MKALLLKTLFVGVVVTLTLAFLIPSLMLFEAATAPAPKGTYKARDGAGSAGAGVVLVFGSMWLANRLSSWGFRKLGITERRWSILTKRGLD